MRSPFAHHWSLDPTVDYLNHGSFGACPVAVLERQQELRDKLEREPCLFFTSELQPLLDESRGKLAGQVGARPEDLGFIPNTTVGVNAVLRSRRFGPGDEILVTSHGYNACNNVARHVGEWTGATVRVVDLPFPVESPDEVVAAVAGSISERTKFALVDHVTSATGMVLPIEKIVDLLKSRGVVILVDGAHAPGMVPVDLAALDVDFYVANCHKWLCGPKGSAFIAVHPDQQAEFVPSVISHGWNTPRRGHTRLTDLLDWPGTFDPTPWLCVGDAIEFLEGLMPGGLDALMRHNRDLVLRGRKVIADRLDLPLPVPEELIGSLATLRLPDDPSPEPRLDETITPTPQPVLQSDLLRKCRIEVPCYYLPEFPGRMFRISAQAYNDLSQYERLAEALGDLLD